MKTVIIPQKMSGTGTIHDIASAHFDREIHFRSDCKYAVVLAAFYGGNDYTTHKTEAAAIASSRRQSGYSHAIIDSDGMTYVIEDDYHGGHLVPVGPCDPYETR